MGDCKIQHDLYKNVMDEVERKKGESSKIQKKVMEGGERTEKGRRKEEGDGGRGWMKEKERRRVKQDAEEQQKEREAR